MAPCSAYGPRAPPRASARADGVVERLLDLLPGDLLLRLEVPPQLLVLPGGEPLPAEEVDRPPPRGGHEPGTRVVGDAVDWPPLQRGDQGVLRQVLGQGQVAHHPGERGDETGGLDPPDRLDRSARRGHALLPTGRMTASSSAAGAGRGAPPPRSGRSPPARRPGAPRPPRPGRAPGGPTRSPPPWTAPESARNRR